MNQKQRARAAGVRAHLARMRSDPLRGRDNFGLQMALERSGLPIVEWYPEVTASDGRVHSIRTLVRLPGGETALIDLAEPKPPGGGWDRVKKDRMARKRRDCAALNIPLLILQRGAVMYLQAQIEHWLIVAQMGDHT